MSWKLDVAITVSKTLPMQTFHMQLIQVHMIWSFTYKICFLHMENTDMGEAPELHQSDTEA